VVTARNRDRVRFSSWGLDGGLAGATCGFTRNPGTDHAEALGNTDVVRCAPGDVLSISASGAGGWGDPFTRPVAEVLRDVAAGKVTEEGARAYGVAVAGGAVDEAATAALRAAPRPPAGLFSYDPARVAFERVWSDAAWDRLAELLFALPVDWRFFMKHQTFARMAADARAEADPVAAVERAFAAAAAPYPQLASLREAAE
jgi:N-methylhydantoinase B